MKIVEKILFPIIIFLISVSVALAAVVLAAVEIEIEYETTTTTLSTTTTGGGYVPGGSAGTTSTTILPPGKQAIITYTITNPDAEIYLSQSVTPILKIKNAGDVDLTDINIEIYELPSDWFIFSPRHIDVISPGQTSTVIITITPNETGFYSYTINISSKETHETILMSLNVKELTPEAIEEIEEEKKLKEKIEEVKKTSELIKLLLIVVGIIAPVIIAVYIILFVLVKKCPLCGSKMKLEYKGKRRFVHQCSRCEYSETREKR